MTPKKQHLDPNAKRDWSVLHRKAVEGIKCWFKSSAPSKCCPFIDQRGRYGIKICQALFPEVQSDCRDIHPCTILYLSDVKKVAKQAIKEWEKSNELL